MNKFTSLFSSWFSVTLLLEGSVLEDRRLPPLSSRLENVSALNYQNVISGQELGWSVSLQELSFVFWFQLLFTAEPEYFPFSLTLNVLWTWHKEPCPAHGRGLPRWLLKIPSNPNYPMTVCLGSIWELDGTSILLQCSVCSIVAGVFPCAIRCVLSPASPTCCCLRFPTPWSEEEHPGMTCCACGRRLQKCCSKLMGEHLLMLQKKCVCSRLYCNCFPSRALTHFYVTLHNIVW